MRQTNPSLILKAAELPAYKTLLSDALEYGRKSDGNAVARSKLACDWLAVAIGKEIQGVVPGVVSTEVDARLSFNTQATVEKARQLSELYREQGADSGRLLIKNRIYLGRYKGCRDTGAGRYPLQSDLVVQLRTGSGLR